MMDLKVMTETERWSLHIQESIQINNQILHGNFFKKPNKKKKKKERNKEIEFSYKQANQILPQKY